MLATYRYVDCRRRGVADVVSVTWTAVALLMTRLLYARGQSCRLDAACNVVSVLASIRYSLPMKPS